MLDLAMDELSHGYCPHSGCETYYYDRCRICAPPHLCEEHTPARDKERHTRFCGEIREKRSQHQMLIQEADNPVPTRGGVHLFLADKTYALVNLLLQAFYPGPLPGTTFSDISKLLNYEKVQLFWSDEYATLATPALYIFRNKDQEAFARTLLTMNLQSSRRALGPPPEINNHRIATFSILQDLGGRVYADRWAFRVPLALIKLRLVLDLRYLEQNPQRLADLQISRAGGALRLKEGGPTRSFMPQLVGSDNLAQRITSLENEIRALAQFSGWKCFWEYMCYPRDCAWRRRNGTGRIPDSMWRCVYLNHYSWVGTPGACEAMIDLLGLREALY